MLTRRNLCHWVATFVLAVSFLAVPPTAGLAVPPPPHNPTDGEIERSRQEAQEKAARVGELTNQLAAVEARLGQLTAEVELAMEEANRAQVDLQAAQDEARRAPAAAAVAHAEAAAARRAVEDVRRRLDAFASASYQRGSVIGSVGALIGSSSPEELLARVQMLDAVSAAQLDVLDDMERARVRLANKDSAARAALEEARARQEAAERAKVTADQARDAAVRAREEQSRRAAELEAVKAEVERQLVQAQEQVTGLEAQRRRYQEWLAAKEREEAAAAAAAVAAAGRPGLGKPTSSAPPASDLVEVVVRRALSQVGVPYAWGGGDANGPTRGIRDGGVADAHGDYKKIGFDCSGLMVYAFAGAGIRLPHYSGYQAQAGRKVPLSQARRGDLLFWATAGRIHHVALYLGDGKMVEAPFSGGYVRVTAVRYTGIVSFAVRLL